MRVTIKSKLAMALGLVPILSILTGVFATTKPAALNVALVGVANSTAERSLEDSEFKVT